MHRTSLILVLMIFILATVAGCAQAGNMAEADLAAVGITTGSGQLGTFSTDYKDGSDPGRDKNMKLASDAINQKVVQPGEEFSFNNALGPTTKQNGYEESTVYMNGKKAKGYGGGVCQVSTTLYNAAANAGMTIVERHDHALPVTYVEAGKEAATSYGVIDFRFKNDLSHPVSIESHVGGGKVTVSINSV